MPLLRLGLAAEGNLLRKCMTALLEKFSLENVFITKNYFVSLFKTTTK